MGPESRFNSRTHLENRMRPLHAPDVRKYTVFDFRQVGSKEKKPFLNLLPGKVTYWPADSSVIVQGEKRLLRPKEQSLLRQLLKQPYDKISSRELSEEIWPGKPYRPTQLPLLVHQLRKKVEPDPSQPTIIQRIKGEGYRFGDPKEPNTNKEIWLNKDIVYNLDQKKITVHGKESLLNSRERSLLDLLIESDHETVSARNISGRVWPGERFNLIKLAGLVKNLRSKVEPDPQTPAIVLRVRGEGYRLADFDPAKERDIELVTGTVKYSTGNRIIEAADNRIHLTEKEHELFMALCENPGSTYCRDELKEKVFDETTKDQVVNNYIGRIRKKLGKEAIETIPLEGFRLNIAA